jgi:hypothetical protein
MSCISSSQARDYNRTVHGQQMLLLMSADMVSLHTILVRQWCGRSTWPLFACWQHAADICCLKIVVKIVGCNEDCKWLCYVTRHEISSLPAAASTTCDCTAANKAYLLYIVGEASRVVEVIWGVNHRHEGSGGDELVCDWSDVSPAPSPRMMHGKCLSQNNEVTV